MLTQEETIAVVGEDALAREELKKEFFSNGEDLQSILEEGYALKKFAEVYKKNGWNNLKAGQVSKIRRAWISIDKAEKDRILALARQRGQVLEAVESSIGISRKAAITANEKVRLIHLRVHPGAALLWADFFGVKTRAELDAAHSNESSERELQVSPANRLAEIFNDFENFRPENLVCKYSDNRKVLENRSPEKISDSAFTILQGLDPNASMGVIRDGDFIKEAWTNLKRELTIVHSRFHRSGNHDGDYQSKNGIHSWVTSFGTDLPTRYAIVVMDQGLLSSLGKTMEIGAGMDTGILPCTSDLAVSLALTTSQLVPLGKNGQLIKNASAERKQRRYKRRERDNGDDNPKKKPALRTESSGNDNDSTELEFNPERLMALEILFKEKSGQFSGLAERELAKIAFGSNANTVTTETPPRQPERRREGNNAVMSGSSDSDYDSETIAAPLSA